MPDKPDTPKPERDEDSTSRSLPSISLDRKTITKKLQKAESNSTKHARKFIVGRIDNLKSAREHILAWFVVVCAVMVAIMGQAVLDERQDAVQASVGGGTYAEGVLGEITTLNPLYASNNAEVAASKLIFSSLYSYDEAGTLTPDLARKITFSTKSNNYVVEMREDALWHDGEQVTADDVLFTLETIKNPDARVNPTLQNNWRDVEVEKVDEYSLRFKLPPYAAFPHALTFAILPEHALRDVPSVALAENSFSQSPVGSGAFELRVLENALTTTGEKVVHMAANDSYYKGVPLVNRFELHAYDSAEDLVSAIEADALTAASDVPTSAIEQISDEGYARQTYPIDNGVYALMNNAQGVFSDKRVRQAVQSIVDTSLVHKALSEQVKPLHLPFLIGQVESSKLPDEPAMNLRKAETLLKKSKYKRVEGVWQKDKKPLAFTITTTQNTQFERAANEIARQLRQFGIEAQVQVIDDTSAISNFVGDVLQRRNFEMLVYELQIGADPDVYAYWHSSQVGNTGYNFTSYRNDTADSLLVSARDRANQKLRSEKYALFAKQWIVDAPAIGLYQQVLTYMKKPNVEALKETAEIVAPTDRYTYVHTWTVNREEVYKTP